MFLPIKDSRRVCVKVVIEAASKHTDGSGSYEVTWLTIHRLLYLKFF